MTSLRITPLDVWIKSRIGLDSRSSFTRDAVRCYQLRKLQETLAYAIRHSPFYRSRLSACDPALPSDFAAFASLPFTTAEDLARDPLEFLCVSQSEVARVVTLRSSGTSGPSKRLFFGEADLEGTIEFFHCGMSTLVEHGQTVLILLPGGTAGSVGDLLATALARMGVTGIVHGPVGDPEKTVAAILSLRPACVVGIPVQVLFLLRHAAGNSIPRGLIRSVLLSTDYVPNAIVDEIEHRWGSCVYQHYGMTEMGYGGGVECDAHDGYHLREADLFFEIIDPQSGAVLPEGVSGEVVVTTLIRRAMPLIRYRTGDVARFRPGCCPCRSSLRRLSKVQGRLSNVAAIGPSLWLSMQALDEAVFSVPGVVDFKAEILPANGRSRLGVTVYGDLRFLQIIPDVTAALTTLPSVREALAQGFLAIDPVLLSPADWRPPGSIKRVLIDRREGEVT